MQPLHPPSSALRSPVFRLDADTSASVPLDALQRSAQEAPTLADLGKNRQLSADATGRVYQSYDSLDIKQGLLECYAARAQQDDVLKATIKESMHALIELYDDYYPLVARGLSDETLESFLYTSISQEEKHIQDTSKKISCPLLRFKAEYSLAILVEDEVVYQNLIEDFFHQLFGRQKADQRLKLLKFLTKPSPRPLTEDFELSRLHLFLQLVNNPKLPFEWLEKKILIESILDFCAQCLAYRWASKHISPFWECWKDLNKAYTALADDPESFEKKEALSPYHPRKALITAFKKAQQTPDKIFSLAPPEGCILALALLEKNLKRVKSFALKLKACEADALAIKPFQAKLFLQLTLYSSQEPLSLDLVKILVEIYCLLIDQPENYQKRWKDVQTLGISLIEAAKARKMPELLDLLCLLLEDEASDIAYKKKIRLYIKNQGFNPMDAVEAFNKAEVNTRSILKRLLSLRSRADTDKNSQLES